MTARFALDRRGALVLMGGALLAGCVTPPPVAPAPRGLAFMPGRILLRVSSVSVGVSNAIGPNASGVFPMRVEDVARLWAERRLAAAGSGPAARFLIDEATAVSQPTADQGLLGPGEWVQASVLARLEIDAGNYAGARASAEGVADGLLTPGEREAFLSGVTADLGSRFDAAMTNSILTRLGAYVAGTV